MPQEHDRADSGLGRRIWQRRRQLGLSGRQLARRTGIEPSQLSKIERGVVPTIRSDTLQALAFHLGVTSDWLLGPYEPEETDEPALATQEK